MIKLGRMNIMSRNWNKNVGFRDSHLMQETKKWRRHCRSSFHPIYPQTLKKYEKNVIKSGRMNVMSRDWS